MRIGRPCGRPRHGFRQALHIVGDSVQVFLRRPERQNRQIGYRCDFLVERKPIAAAVDEQPTVEAAVARTDDLGQAVRLSAVKYTIGPPLPAYLARWVGQDIRRRVVAQDSAEAGKMRSRSLAGAALAAANEYDAGHSPRSRT